MNEDDASLSLNDFDALLLRDRPPDQYDLCFSVAGCTALAASLLLPWVTARGAQHVKFEMASYPLTASMVAAGCAIVGLIVTCEMRAPTRFLRSMETVLASFIALFPIVVLAVIEITTIWLFPSFLPSTIRRVVIGFSPGVGMAVACLGATAILVGAVRAGRVVTKKVETVARGVAAGDASGWAGALAVAAAVMLVVARYQPWLTLRSQAGRWSVPGFALPVVGLATLVIGAICLVLIAITLRRPHPATAVLAVVGGWLLTIPATAAIAIGVPNSSLSMPSFLRNNLNQWFSGLTRAVDGVVHLPHTPTNLSVMLGTGTGSVIQFAGGLTLAAAAVFGLQTQEGD